MNEIWVRLDADFEVGEAHAVRSASVLAALRAPHRLKVFGVGDRLARHFPGAEIMGDNLLEALRARKPALLYVDHPRPGANFWTELRSAAGNVPIAAVDDFGGEIEADLIVNGTVLEEYHRYPRAHADARVLAGGRFALLRPAFRGSPWKDAAARGVTMAIGSGERAREWAHFLASPATDMRSWGPLRMIVGGAFPDFDSLSAACDAKGITLSRAIPAEAMAAAFAESALVLITGGMIVYESITVGVPAVVYPQLANLVPEAVWFAARGCTVNLGYDGGTDWASVRTAVEELLGSSDRRRAMSRAQRATLDGEGVARAAAALDELLARGAP